MLEITRAEPSDLIEVVRILEDARLWLLSRKIEQWPYAWTQEWLAANAAQHEIYLAPLNGQTIGTLSIQWSDEEIWGEMPYDAGYIHRLVVARDFKGRGFGSELLRWGEERIKADHKHFARLDCRSDNPKLRSYYENAGYIYQRSAETHWGLLSLYEKDLR